VVTVNVTVAGFVPSSVMLVGDAEQVDPRGAPEQLRFTVWLNPSIGVRFKVKFAVWPAFNVAEVGDTTATKSALFPLVLGSDSAITLSAGMFKVVVSALPATDITTVLVAGG